ncbi:microfibril-associated glycoprotein 4-like [Diadema antillarum]|uniref:microfibril-associated glycoprotein 4-like n=1 Tax=Diadema antillarum TaxID=105358 RepID=UPI003A891C51
MAIKLFLFVSCLVTAFAWQLTSSQESSSSSWQVEVETEPTSPASQPVTDELPSRSESSSESSVPYTWSSSSVTATWSELSEQTTVAMDSASTFVFTEWVTTQDPPDTTHQNSCSNEPVPCSLSPLDRCRIERILNLTEALVEFIVEEDNIEDQQTSTSQTSLTPPRDCSDLAASTNVSGRYAIYPDDNGDPFFVYCDMETDGGGWTVFQRRQDGTVDFYRGWCDYKHGFGNMLSEFWLGNDKIHRLTSGASFQLRVDLADFDDETRFAMYDAFSVPDESSGYLLTVSGYSGNAGDSLSGHSNRLFATKDHDSDLDCAVDFHGAWWYEECHYSNLNGRYLGGQTAEYGTGVVWADWRGYYYSLRKTEMKIRRLT